MHDIVHDPDTMHGYCTSSFSCPVMRGIMHGLLIMHDRPNLLYVYM